jgi:putative phage-type endonuclease
MPTDKIIYSFDVKQNWLECRSKGIGGSDAAAILGLSPYKTNQEVWKEKVDGVIPEQKETPAMLYGQKAEACIVNMWLLDYPEYSLIDKPSLWTLEINPNHQMIRGSFDCELRERATDTEGILEIKTSYKSVNHVPLHYYIQCLHYMLVRPSLSFAAIRIYDRTKKRFWDATYQRDMVQNELDLLLEKELEFWDFVQECKEPPLKLIADIRFGEAVRTDLFYEKGDK